MEILNKTFWEYKEGNFELTQEYKHTSSIDIWRCIIQLKELEANFKNIPAKIEQLEKEKVEIKKSYNDWIALLNEAKEKYNLEDLEIPSIIE
jgi:hypothetical protein